MGGVRGSVRGVCDRAGVQHPDPGATAVFWLAVFDELGAVSEVWEVSALALESSLGWFRGGVFFSFLVLCDFVLFLEHVGCEDGLASGVFGFEAF